MKNLFFALLIIATFSTKAQNCGTQLFLQNNKTIEMSIFDKKQKLTGRNIYKISNAMKEGNTYTATINSQLYDDKGNMKTSASSTAKCNNGVFYVDVRMQMSPDQSNKMNVEASVDGSYLAYPNLLAVGDKLPDGHFNIRMGGAANMVQMNITDRQVVAQESVTTPAGTWNCYKITSKSSMKILIIPIKTETTEWYAPSIGIIKSSSKYGTTEITKIE